METEKAASTSRFALLMRSVRTGIFGTLFVSILIHGTMVFIYR